MPGRVRRKIALAAMAAGRAPDPPPCCALCDRPLGVRVERHHVVPRSEGGTETVPLHPICHRAIHAAVDTSDLARAWPTMAAVRGHPRVERFLAWVADKPADFHAPTRRGRRRR